MAQRDRLEPASRELADKQRRGAAIRQLRSRDPSAWVEAAEAWGRSQDAEAVEALVESLSSTESTLRVAAIMALGRIGHKRVARSIEACLRDQIVLVRVAAAHVLGVLRDPDSVEPLRMALRTETEPEVRRYLETAIAKLPDLAPEPQSQISLSATMEEGIQSEATVVSPPESAELVPPESAEEAAIEAAEPPVDGEVPAIRAEAGGVVEDIRHQGPELDDDAPGEKVGALESPTAHEAPSIATGQDTVVVEPEDETSVLSVLAVAAEDPLRVNEWDLLRVTVENGGSRPMWVTDLALLGPIEVQGSGSATRVTGNSTVELQVGAKPTESGRHVPVMVRVTYRGAVGPVKEVSDLHFLSVTDPRTGDQLEGPSIVVSGDYIAGGGTKAGGDVDVFSPHFDRRRESVPNPGHPNDFCPVKQDAIPPGRKFCDFCGERI